jgi:hypothetical protein
VTAIHTIIKQRVLQTSVAALAVLGMLPAHQVAAQTFITRSQEIRLGFYAGRATYYGDYNPGPFGTPFVYGFNENSPEAQKGLPENNFGGWLKLPLNPTFSVLLRGDFGSLGYEDAGLNYTMATSYNAVGASLEINPLHSFMVQPYVSLGAGMMRYTLPPKITNTDLEAFSPGSFKDKAQAMYFPVSLGVSYPLSPRVAFFAEYSLNLTNADNLDNLALPSNLMQSSYANDAFSGVRVGINVALLKFLNLKRNRKAVRKPVYMQAAAMEPMQLEREKLRPLKLVPADTLRMYYDAMKSEQDRTKISGPAPVPKPPVAAVITPPVPVTKKVEEPAKKIAPPKPPEQREFKQEEQKQVVAQVTLDRTRARAEAKAAEEARKAAEPEPAKEPELVEAEQKPARPAGPLKDKKELKNIVDRTDPTLYTDETDPFIPKLFIKPRAIPEEIIVDGFVTRDPPVGYYVQIYATVGPISAQRNRQKAIELLKDYLEDPETQVIITQRRQFYEVRIGVFDTYDDTISVLEQVLGTYYDAYSLIYLTDNL